MFLWCVLPVKWPLIMPIKVLGGVKCLIFDQSTGNMK